MLFQKQINALVENKKVINVCNKSDVGAYSREGVKVCAKSGDGIEEVISLIMKKVNRDSIYSEGVITNERHIYALEECMRNLQNAYANYEFSPTECTLLDIHNALIELGKITGNNVSESIVDEVFSRFCVGK